jgi:DNA repair photolyase
MSLTKQTGNMYPWVTHMHSHLRGACPHGCAYCYVQSTTAGRCGIYTGTLRLAEKELAVNYGSGKTIFIDHMNDLWAEKTPGEFRSRIVAHCQCWPKNTYVFQTKNPHMYHYYGYELDMLDVWLGCTVETNRVYDCMGNTPAPEDRTVALPTLGAKTFLTIEPILDFGLDEFAAMIINARPDFVNIGADSKGHRLPEPSPEKLAELIRRITAAGIEIREKHNLGRLLPTVEPTKGA